MAARVPVTNGTQLLEGFTEGDIEWLFSVAKERPLPPATVLIPEGGELDSLFIVLQGYLGVFVGSAGKGQVGAMGPGEMAGEMSFLEQKKAIASVIAVEDAVVLALPFGEIEKRISSTPDFGVRFFRSLAKLISRRLRGRTRSEHPVAPENATDESPGTAEQSEAWKKIKSECGAIDQELRSAEADAAANGKKLSEKGTASVDQVWLRLATVANEILGPSSPENPLVKEEIGAFLQNFFMPSLMQTAVMKRIVTKPRGYAGDCIAIADIHSSTAGGSTPVGIALDRCFIRSPACAAMRSRRVFIADEIRKLLSNRKDPVLVTCISGGPADELFDVYQKLTKPDQLHSSVIDLDSQAVSFLEMRREKQFLESHMSIHNENVIYLSTGQSKLSLPPQDLVYSIGLIDYFEDNTVISLINFIHGILKPKGAVVLGNFHPDNPTRPIMDHLLGWKYVHRTPEDMQRLFRESHFKRPPGRIRWDDQRIYLFAECIR